MAVDEVRYNGRAYSHKSFQLSVHGVRLHGVKELAWKPSVDKAEARGFSAKPLGFTDGEYKFEASMTVHLREWLKVKEALKAKGVNPFTAQGNVDITIKGQGGLPTVYVLLEIDGIKEEDNSTSGGPDPTEVKIPFYVLDILEGNPPTSVAGDY